MSRPGTGKSLINMGQVEIEQKGGSVVLEVKVVPKSSRTQIAGALGDKLKIKLRAAPEKGKANDELVKFLSSRLGVKKNQVQIISGQASASKQVRIEGVDATAVRAKLGSGGS